MHDDVFGVALDQATAARSIEELRIEIETLKRLEGLALGIRRSGEDKKWRELASLLGEIFTAGSISNAFAEDGAAYDAGGEQPPAPKPSPHQKLVLFTEHRDTANYLTEQLERLGFAGQVAQLHGAMDYVERDRQVEFFRKPIDSARDKFRQDFFLPCPTMVDYLHLELVRTLANDDPELLGTEYPGPMA